MTAKQMFITGVLLIAFGAFVQNTYAASGYSYAKKYVGLHEVRDNKALKKILTVNPAKTPWCADFINSMEKKAGNKGTNSLMARSFLKYGARSVIFMAVPGDIIVLRRGNSRVLGHVGYFVSQTNYTVTILAGNQGDRVAYATYPKSMVIGVRRP